MLRSYFETHSSASYDSRSTTPGDSYSSAGSCEPHPFYCKAAAWEKWDKHLRIECSRASGKRVYESLLISNTKSSVCMFLTRVFRLKIGSLTMDQEAMPAMDERTQECLPPKPPKRSLSPSAHRKPCSICHIHSDVLVRCRIDDTPTWHFVCPKKCWKGVSGAVIDGDSEHPYYKYGGMWKNKHAGVSAKKPKPKKKPQGEAIREWKAIASCMS